MDPSQQIEDSKAVIVTNISNSANEKTVSDFFSFCGKITNLFLKTEEGAETNSAIVQFETEAAAKTALLLSNALIIDKPITVIPYGGTSEEAEKITPPTKEDAVDHSKITQREFSVPDEERSKTSVIASMLAAGYVLGHGALDKAKDFDEKTMFSLKAKVAVEQMKNKAHEIDVQFGLSEKAAVVEKSIYDTAKQIDSSFHISEKAQSAANTFYSTAQSAANKMKENPTFAMAYSTTKETADYFASTVTKSYNEVKEQTQKAIEEKQHKPEAPVEGSSTSNKAAEEKKESENSSEIPVEATTTSSSTPNPVEGEQH